MQWLYLGPVLFTPVEVTQKKECAIRAERSADNDKNDRAEAINTIEKGNKTQKEMGNGRSHKIKSKMNYKVQATE